MLKWFLRRQLTAFSRKFGYDVTYMLRVLETDPGAILRVFRAGGLGTYRRSIPLAPWHAARVAAAMQEDCGPCAQLSVTMSRQEGVPAATLRAVAAKDFAAMPEDVALAVRFTEAVLAHDSRADALREQVVKRWGDEGLISLAFAITSAHLFPMIKWTLGYLRHIPA